ncbi:MAG TPA: ferritin-like domain-containing protein [Phenylobacterium sp.]|uniref:ferritin-like domain-containing protein n=1 Tax=Phenylobacterium sp. TaxID=1871053 RepID=UPI002C099628|nr:ferritin-like domain-containing protein [Phenylobacterium sp.]HSV04297.1 ferritin-like domain-containing protein [Phenylobacterium sp.]
MADGNITKDAMYGAVAPDDFEAMLTLDRYGQRSTAFDKIISATHDHFWDPLDPKYIDFSEPWDMENEPLVPEDQMPLFRLPYIDGMLKDPKERIRFINYMQLRSFSSILHGEQGALNLSASLCHVLYDQGAQEYAANQTREEARHVTAFARYIKARWGRPVECGAALKALLIEIIEAPEVYKKIVGMQMLVEGLAMGAFSNGYRYNRDPLARKLFQLVMTDEAFHHKFGKIWADRTVPQLSQAERDLVEDWTAHCAQNLLFDRGDPRQQAEIYAQFGLDPERVIADIVQRRKERDPTRKFKGETNVFRVLIKTLLNARLITERTRWFYAMYVDMDELAAEGERTVGDDIAEDGIRYLQAINFKAKSGDGARSVSIAAE